MPGTELVPSNTNKIQDDIWLLKPPKVAHTSWTFPYQLWHNIQCPQGWKKAGNEVQYSELIHYLWFFKLSNRYWRLFLILTQFPNERLKERNTIIPVIKFKIYSFMKNSQESVYVYGKGEGKVIIQKFLLKKEILNHHSSLTNDWV